MLKIKGILIEEKNKGVEGEWTIEEIAAFIQEGRSAMISLSGYTIKENGLHAFASGLTLFPGETIPYMDEGKIVVPTHFRRHMIYGYDSNDSEELIPVHCIVEPDDEMLYISIHEKHLEQ